ncbi:MAG TPA: hypothetical protein VN735_02560 [Steroidobacteraceae bacterium]|nr:hypothetical protein [Steroidobacteraceae bacterium]
MQPQPLTDRQLLDVCGRGHERHPLDRALLLLAAALPGEETGGLADLTLAERDQALLALRAATFGRRLASYIDCASCGQRLEFQLDTANLLAISENAPAQGTVQLGERRFRLPTSRDLARIAEVSEEAEASRRLAGLCCIDGGEAALSNELIANLEEAFARADPGGNIQLNFDCPACHRSWEEVFDIGEYFWEELETSSRLLIAQVHRLASAYGWSEHDILSLGAVRRALYIELVDA